MRRHGSPTRASTHQSSSGLEAHAEPLRSAWTTDPEEQNDATCTADTSSINWAALLFGSEDLAQVPANTALDWLDTLHGSVPLGRLRRACLHHVIPSAFRPWAWLLLLGALPPMRATWRIGLVVRRDMYNECVRFATLTGLRKLALPHGAKADSAIEIIFWAYVGYLAAALETRHLTRMDEAAGAGLAAVRTPHLRPYRTDWVSRLERTRHWIQNPEQRSERSAILAQIHVFDAVFRGKPELAWWCLARFREQERRLATNRLGQTVESFDSAYRVRLVLHLVDVADQEAAQSPPGTPPQTDDSEGSTIRLPKQAKRLGGFSALVMAMLKLAKPGAPQHQVLPRAEDAKGATGRRDSPRFARSSEETSLTEHSGAPATVTVRALFERAAAAGSSAGKGRSQSTQELEMYARHLLQSAFAERLSLEYCVLMWDRVFAAGPDLMAHLAFQLLVQLAFRHHEHGAPPERATLDKGSPHSGKLQALLQRPSAFLCAADIEAICDRASNAADYLLGYDGELLDDWDPIYAFDVQWPVLERGDQGALVRILQHLLRARGYGNWFTIDGVYGIRTCTAVARFQQDLAKQFRPDRELPARRAVHALATSRLDTGRPLTVRLERLSSGTAVQAAAPAAAAHRPQMMGALTGRRPLGSPDSATASREYERYRGDQVNDQLWPELVVPVSAGDRGDAVMALQVALRDLHGYDAVRIDGFFGRRTEAAVRDFQRRGAARLMPIDGLVGPVTWLHLLGS
jgi:peptidoglycan hydrolase-like protein with peptidoglycan-binding domain